MQRRRRSSTALTKAKVEVVSDVGAPRKDGLRCKVEMTLCYDGLDTLRAQTCLLLTFDDAAPSYVLGARHHRPACADADAGGAVLVQLHAAVSSRPDARLHFGDLVYMTTPSPGGLHVLSTAAMTSRLHWSSRGAFKKRNLFRLAPSDSALDGAIQMHDQFHLHSVRWPTHVVGFDAKRSELVLRRKQHPVAFSALNAATYAVRLAKLHRRRQLRRVALPVVYVALEASRVEHSETKDDAVLAFLIPDLVRAR
ncbi:hypothetical protein SDRG_07028 [Saprolegnia diclina VS20]|uniref:Uncharacterized protein n=1 Tax=Saprolegnia diclina (strain VS20) TaxID=1156394 RepID=T0RY59_SAPDV|nr:hypothetical protein SDRG_07028 [Saprolegnia diclina VS20]EQC35317.1 hypothetical protein SDRG_07028 [Saprolegnia diclina VS20]|eukprot:XP_008611067.1 hypothetical protein SDRG_07028 [Saprolegnia diclina VS20]